MPHIIIEHSAGINAAFDVEALVDALHNEAISQTALPTGGLRTRSHCTEFSRIGDGEVGREFIYIIVRLGEGRTKVVKRKIGESLFKILTNFTAEYFDAGNSLSLGLEVQEIEKDWTWKKNNIHQILKDKT